MRVIIVHNAEHIRAALEVGKEQPCEVALQTAPDAIFYAGSLYLLRMFEQEKEQFPDVKAYLILDCADSHAKAIEAMQQGHTHIRSAAPPEIQKKLAAMAAENGVTFHTQPYEALDLQAIRVTKDALKVWHQRNLCT